jgi:hypothetical protein
MLIMADIDDPLFLQVKETGPTVLESMRKRVFVRTMASGW